MPLTSWDPHGAPSPLLSPAFSPARVMIYELASRPAPALLGAPTNPFSQMHPLPWAVLALALLAAACWYFDLLPGSRLLAVLQWSAVAAVSITLTILLVYAGGTVDTVRLAAGMAMLLVVAATLGDARWFVTVPLALAAVVATAPVGAGDLQIGAAVLAMALGLPTALLLMVDQRRLHARIETLADVRRRLRDVEEERDRIARSMRVLSHDAIGTLTSLRNLAASRDRVPEPLMRGAIDSATALTSQFEAATEEADGTVPTLRPDEPVDLGAEVQEAADLIRLRLLAARGSLAFSGEFPTVSGDPQTLRQVLFALFDNAVKHADRNHPLRLELTGETFDDMWHLTVTGPAAPLDDFQLQQVFLRGARAAADRRGFGRGLTEVQQIVAEHGGRVWLSSAGRRVSAHLLLPIDQQVHADPDGDTPSSACAPHGSASSSSA